jgi:dTDP-4-dehydrorhamnose 3,5-epimerase
MSFKLIPTAIPDVKLIEPQVFGDARGSLFESYKADALNEALGREVVFVQENQSYSVQHVLRGLHFQVERPQGKLIRAVTGEVLDIAVDLRQSSPTFMRSVAIRISAQNRRQVWIPEGFAHGFRVLSAAADMLYKMTDYRSVEHERCVIWNDPTLNVDWGTSGMVILSDKDAQAQPLTAADLYP